MCRNPQGEVTLKILSFSASNFLALRVVEITPGPGPVVTISGRNGQGKTSLLDAIYFALTGVKPAKPVREGEEWAAVKIELGSGTLPEITVSRIISKDIEGNFKATLRVEGDGVTYKKPQAMLDGLLGALSFDPLEFCRLEPKVQREKLLDLLGLNFMAQDKKRKELYDERTLINRDIKNLEGQAAKYQTADSAIGLANVPAEPVDVEKLMGTLGAINSDIGSIEQDMADRDRMEKEIAATETKLASLRSAVKALNAGIQDRNLTGRMNERTILQNQIASASKINELVAQDRERRGLLDQKIAKVREADALSAGIDEIDRAKEAAIAEAKMPIPGLSFDDLGLLYNGVPLAQAASSEQIKVTMAMACAMNPKLKVLRIKDGSLLDQSSMKIIEEMAGAAGAQVWLERVEEDGSVGFTIEQGEIKA